MNIDNFLFGTGLNAFEDAPVVADADPVAVAAAAVAAESVAELVEAQGERDIAISRATISQLDSELAAEERVVDTALTAVDHIELVTASLESFAEQGGLSVKTAQLLQQQINSVMGSVGVSGVSVTNGGLESLDFQDPDNVMVLLAGSLEAIENEKKGIAARAWEAVKRIFATIVKFVGEAFSQNKRVRARADDLAGAIKGKPAKEVGIVSQYLLVGKDYSSNLVADLGKFKNGLVKGSVAAITTRGDWYFKTAATAVTDIATTPTLDNALNAVRKLTPPPVAGASVSVKDENGMALKRTEVFLGNYAIFELQNKAPAPTDADSAVNFINAMVKGRISIQQAKVPSPGAKLFNMNEAAGQQIIKAVKDILGEADALKPAMEKLAGLLNTAEASAKGDAKEAGNEKDVKRIASAATKIPAGLTDTVSQLPRMISRAALNVSEAALDLVATMSKGGLKTADADKGAKPPKKEEEKTE